jgi:aspartate/methionine/tyrosine aminotransferase
MTSVDLCKVLINKPYQVYLVPGTAYGEAHEGHVRVGFGGSHQIITEAFEVIEEFTEEHRK